jgi:phage-related protein
MEPEAYIKKLQEISVKKVKLIEEILNLTKAQSQSIAAEDLNGLENLISNKQKLIDEISKLDEEFSGYFQGLKRGLKIKNLDELKDINIPGVDKLQSIISSIMKTVKEVCEIEKQNEAGVKKLMNVVGDEIRKINQAKKANAAYMPRPISSSSYFIDKKK